MCYHCITRLGTPRLAISLIGSNKKEFKKDFYDFCPHCFEYLFGSSIIFTTHKNLAMSCHMCESVVIGSLPYSYFMHFYKFTDGNDYVGKRRICGPCSTRELFPIISSLLIVRPPQG